MATSKITSKGQVTIPKQVRERLSLHPGDVLEFRFDEAGRVVLEPVAEELLGRLPGLLGHLAKDEPVTVEEMRAALRKRARKKMHDEGLPR